MDDEVLLVADELVLEAALVDEALLDDAAVDPPPDDDVDEPDVRCAGAAVDEAGLEHAERLLDDAILRRGRLAETGHAGGVAGARLRGPATARLDARVAGRVGVDQAAASRTAVGIGADRASHAAGGTDAARAADALLDRRAGRARGGDGRGSEDQIVLPRTAEQRRCSAPPAATPCFRQGGIVRAHATARPHDLGKLSSLELVLVLLLLAVPLAGHVMVAVVALLVCTSR